MGAKHPSEVPSFVYRQDGFELSYAIWEQYSVLSVICQREELFAKSLPFDKEIYTIMEMLQ